MDLQQTLTEIFPKLIVSTKNDDGSAMTIVGHLGNSQVFTLWASEQTDGWIFIPQVLNEQSGIFPSAREAIAWIREKLGAMRPRQTVGWHGVGQERPPGFGRPKTWKTPGITRPIRVPEIAKEQIMDLLHKVDDPDPAVVAARLSYLVECLEDY